MTSLLSDFHGSRLHMSDFDRTQTQPDVHRPDPVSEPNVVQRLLIIFLPLAELI